MTWVSYGKTESSDDLPLIIWGEKKPTNEQVETAYRERLPDEYEEVGFVNWCLAEAEDVSHQS